MKKSKVLALVLSAAMLICAMPMVGFAASPITIDDVTVADNATNPTTLYDVTVTYSVTGDVAAQTTVLVTQAATLDTTGDTNILFIDQMDKVASFTFSVAKADVVDNKIYIKMGGSDVTDPTDVYEKATGSTPTGFSITGYIAAYSSGATVTLGEKSAQTDANGQFTLTEVADGTYALVITAKAALTRTIDVAVDGADVAVSTSDNKIDLMYGDVNNSGKIDVSDLIAVKNLFNKASGADGFDANVDLNDSGKIDVSDLIAIKNLFNKSYTNYATWSIPQPQ